MSSQGNGDSYQDLVEELTLGSARGGKRQPAAQVMIEPVRSLGEADIELLANPPVVGAPMSIPEIKAQHHRLASLLAKGISNSEISLITGFSPSYISTLKNAPDMKDLVKYYQDQVEERTVDAMARLKMLGISSLEELQNRLNDSPEKFSSNQLMDMIEMGLIKPLDAAAVAAGAKGQGNGTPIQINLNFKSPEKSLAEGPGPLLEQKVSKG